MFATPIVESIHADAADQSTVGSMPLHVQKEMTHYSEINDKIFNTDMNM
jgi:hypothetical protein